MTDYIQLFIGTLLLTLLSLYVAWTKFRVLKLRQQLFDTRNLLWDEARRLNCLNDPAYSEVREVLNAMICTAHRVDLAVVLHLMSQKQLKVSEYPQSNNLEFQTAIDEACNRTSRQLTNYVLFARPFSGIATALMLIATHKTIASIAAVRDVVDQWFRGGGPRQLELSRCH
jgi:hypothetical protein